MRSVVVWAVAGALASFAVIAGLSIGIFFVLPAIVALVFATRSPSGWPAAGVGIGAILLLVATLNRGAGDLDARPWLGAGLALSLVGALATRRRLRGPRA
jgi:hypothetical protein